MDTLRRKRLQQRLLIAVSAVTLVLAVVFSVLHTSPEEREESEIAEAVLGHEPGRLPSAERERLREQWRRLPPESRTRVFRAVAGARLAEFREQAKGLDREERQQRIKQRTDELRQRRAGLSREQRQQLRERLSTDEAKEIVAHVLEFYRDELTARERAELDPLIHEWLYHMDALMGAR